MDNNEKKTYEAINRVYLLLNTGYKHKKGFT